MKIRRWMPERMSPPTAAESPPPARVALVSLRLRAEAFFDDEDTASLEGALASHGVAHAVLESTRGERSDVAWHREVARAIGDEGFDIVVMPRAWDAETIASIRGAMPAAGKVLRLSRGAPAALDHGFDAVVSVDGVLDVLRGEATPHAPAIRATRAELRQRADASRAAPARRLVEAGDTDGRPTIAGPARGCPYLVDVRTSPAFAGESFDTTKIQTKGCSFCLDNNGAFATFTEEDVVATWLDGLRAIRATRPDAREILLTDERPHPYLPALFRALLDEGFAPVELLIKTRVDWLLSFAATALAEALALAERGGHVLHVYLIGFESFDQGHLDLYNKGVTVADNIAAIACIRALAAKFPRSLEYKRLKAHGIILFSPWTSPASLLENARVMREVGFDELRSQALHTRLRLYPNVPLHAKAEREGLLVDRFENTRPDRAVEQGYDASVPWRFADARSEAIFCAANALCKLDDKLPEADVLELVARYVTRWPGLAACPDDARLPLVASLHTWGRPYSDVLRVLGPVLAGHDREIEGVVAGDKDACLKEEVPADDAARLVRAYRAMGLSAAIVSRHDLRAGGDHAPSRPAGTHAIVAVARDDQTLADVNEAQHAVERDGSTTAIERMGELLGFPRCCVEAFVSRPRRGDNLDLELAPFRAHPADVVLPENGRLATGSLVSHHLCRPACSETSVRALKTMSRLRAIDAGGSARLWERLTSSMLFIDYARSAWLDGAWRDGAFIVERGVGSLGVPIEPGASLALDAAGVHVTYPDSATRDVRAAYPLLIEPGHPLSPYASAAIQPRDDIDAQKAERISALDAGEPTPLGELPPLPVGVRVGARFGAFAIVTVRTRPQAFEVLLSRGREVVRLRLRAWSTPSVALRRGPWAIDIAGAKGLDDLAPQARAAVGALVRDLVDDAAHASGKSTTATSTRDAADGS